MQAQYFEQLAKIIPNVSHETFSDLCAYETLLCKWQSQINLIAPSTVSHIWSRHILDSAKLFPLADQAKIWLDLGSGGGFPALVIACLLKQRNKALHTDNAHIYLVESNTKKAAFLRQVIQSVRLPATVYHSRIETVIHSLPPINVITARALASLDKLFSFVEPLFKHSLPEQKLTALLQKGRGFEQEIILAKRHWIFDMDIKPGMEAGSVVLLIRNLQKSMS